MWHTGTLDPLATGCLSVVLWEYTKLIPYLEKSRKSYRAEIELWATSQSYDSDSEITRIPVDQLQKIEKSISKKSIEEILHRDFLGDISQLPPKVSALKVDWKTSLERLRNGEEFELQKRPVTIHAIELLGFDFPKITIETTVSSGTYIRSIARDLWDILGSGAILTALRRTQIDHLSLENAAPLETIQLSDMLDVEKVFAGHFFFDSLPGDVLERLSHGQRIAQKFDFPKDTPLFYISHGRIEYVLKYDGYILRVDKKVFA